MGKSLALQFLLGSTVGKTRQWLSMEGMARQLCLEIARIAPNEGNAFFMA